MEHSLSQKWAAVSGTVIVLSRFHQKAAGTAKYRARIPAPVEKFTGAL